jgi:carbamoyltransferase
MKFYLGISAFYHDSAVALFQDDKLIFAIQEERISRKKHDSRFPSKSINLILQKFNLNLNNIEAIVFYEKPLIKFDRLLESYVHYAPKGIKSFVRSIPLWLKEKLYQKEMILNELKLIDENFNDKKKIKFSEHHLSHAASAFFSSNYSESAILTVDGVGEWTTTAISHGKDNNIKIIDEIYFPHSLGLLYSAFTYYVGFKVNSGEYKLMGLAPYGRPTYTKLIKEKLIKINEDGSFKLNMKYFSFVTDIKMTNDDFNNLFNQKRREPEEKLTNFHFNIAASIQEVLEEILLLICKKIKKMNISKNLCLAGGVALNCVANSKILESELFDNIYIQPASGDAGGAIGAVQNYLYLEKKIKRKINKDIDYMSFSYLGTDYSREEVLECLNKYEVIYEELDEKNLYEKVSALLIEGQIGGWFQGKMEFGPRALGNRSIIGDPRNKQMQKNLNLKIKFRESFRPFAPAVRIENLDEWFNFNIESPYMLYVGNIAKSKKNKDSEKINEVDGLDKLYFDRSKIQAVTHVDFSARLQTVSERSNKKFHELITKFYEKTGCPILVNTSFNVRGEPIVNTPEEAYNCFLGTNMDFLAIGNILIQKKNQITNHYVYHKDKFELD